MENNDQPSQTGGDPNKAPSAPQALLTSPLVRKYPSLQENVITSPDVIEALGDVLV
jgi:hypothetical protein